MVTNRIILHVFYLMIIIVSGLVVIYINQLNLKCVPARNIGYVEHSFCSKMRSFPWNLLNDSVQANNSKMIELYLNVLLMKLVPFIIEAPPVPVNKSCIPPPLSIPGNCKKFKEPRKIGMLIQFGFDVDALEIHLHELDEIVDKFFLIESVSAHGVLVKRKPLIWERLKFDERFEKFIHKIVHFVVDDSGIMVGNQSKEDWRSEFTQEKLRWIKFLEWNSISQFFGPQDILGFGDVDEVASRKTVWFLKNCEMPIMPADIGIWFPFGGLNTVFATDHPVPYHRFSLGDPTFWTLHVATDYYRRTGNTPNRMRGQSPGSGFLLGGLHLSRYPYQPFMMSKMLAASEAEIKNLRRLVEIGTHYAEEDFEAGDMKLNQIDDNLMRRIFNISSISANEARNIIQLPWLYSCNPNRYPSLERKYDHRLDGNFRSVNALH